MGWEVLIPLIIQVGIPLAERIWQKASAGTQVTQADWDELKALSQRNARSELKAILTREGIAMDSPQAVALLSQVP